MSPISWGVFPLGWLNFDALTIEVYLSQSLWMERQSTVGYTIQYLTGCPDNLHAFVLWGDGESSDISLFNPWINHCSYHDCILDRKTIVVSTRLKANSVAYTSYTLPLHSDLPYYEAKPGVCWNYFKTIMMWIYC